MRTEKRVNNTTRINKKKNIRPNRLHRKTLNKASFKESGDAISTTQYIPEGIHKVFAIAEGDKLLERAKLFFKKLSDTEVSFFKNLGWIIFNNKINNKSQSNNIIRAECIAWILMDNQAYSMMPADGIYIDNAYISGILDLNDCKANLPISLVNCKIEKKIILNDAKLAGVCLAYSSCVDIIAYNLCISGNLILRNINVRGIVNITNSEIGGNMECQNGVFHNISGKSIAAQRSKIYGSVFLNKAKTYGEVSFLRADIGGDLECVNCVMHNTAKFALCADRLNIKGGVFLNLGSVFYGEVRLIGANIGVDLTCNASTFNNPGAISLCADRCRIRGCMFLNDNSIFRGEVHIIRAEIENNLECCNSKFENITDIAFSADGAHIKGSAFLRDNSQFSGVVSFSGATIEGQLDCRKSKFKSIDEISFRGDNIRVHGNLFFSHSTFYGTILLADSNIGGKLSCAYCKSESFPTSSLNLNGACVSRNIDFSYSQFFSFITMGRLKIGDDLICKNTEFKNWAFGSISADGIEINGKAVFNNCTILGEFILNNSKISGILYINRKKSDFNNRYYTLQLSSSYTKVLHIVKNSWPEKGNLYIDGLKYDRFMISNRTKQDDNNEWLSLQAGGYHPQPYEQMALTFRNAGNDARARDILITKNVIRHQQMQKHGSPLINRLWISLLGMLCAYGYKPWKAIGWWLSTWISASCIVSTMVDNKWMIPTLIDTQNATIIADKIIPSYIPMTSVGYSFDLITPIVNTGYLSSWTTTNNISAFILALLAIIGYFLVALFAAAITGIISDKKSF